MDFSTLASGLDSGTAVTAIIAMGAIMILPNFAKWVSRKVANFFS